MEGLGEMLLRAHRHKIKGMAYDEDLADRIRELLGGEFKVTEKKMFGGLAFLIGGHMAISASGQGGVLLRVDPEQSDSIVASTKASEAVMRGRPMQGWLRVAPDDIRTKRQLTKWVQLGAKYASSLPPKR
jgi:TfoX/Sxy family transcriptional regulator of competence genes